MAGLLAAQLQPALSFAGAGQRVPFNGMFPYVLAGPAVLAHHWRWRQPNSSGFVLTIAGIMAGPGSAGRLAGIETPSARFAWGLP